MSARPIVSAAELKSAVDALKSNICRPETEDSWEIISRNIKALGDICLNGACDFPADLIPILRTLSRPLTTSMISERTRLSGAAIDLINTVASGVGASFEPLLPVFLPVLLSLCARTNKVIIARARGCITIIIETTQLPSILPYFLQSIKDKSTSLRLAAAEGTFTCMNCFNPPDLEKDARARDIEAVIRATARDAQAEIRAVSKKIFEAYKLLLPNRIDSFIAPLTPTMKKYLDIKSSNLRSQPVLSRLAAPALEAKNTLTSSTSALTARGRPESNQPSMHMRSASSSAISTSRAAKEPPASEKTTRPVQAKKPGTDMPPPQYVPVRPPQPASQGISVSRSTSAVVPPVRLVGAQVTQSNASSGLPSRPTSANGSREAARRPQQPVPVLPALSRELSNGPRRVPIPETTSKNSDATKRQRVNSTREPPVTQPSIFNAKPTKPNNNNPSLAGTRPEKAKPVPKLPSEGHPGSKQAPAAPAKPAKPSGIMQPTLSQISRAKAAIRDKPSVDPAPKRLWGRPPAPRVNPLAKSTSSIQQATIKAKARPVSMPVPKSGVRSITPAQVPLPPSPTPSYTITEGDELNSRPQSPLSPPPAPLLAPMNLPTEGKAEDAGQQDIVENSGSSQEETTVCVADSKEWAVSVKQEGSPIQLATQNTNDEETICVDSQPVVIVSSDEPDSAHLAEAPNTPRPLLFSEDPMDLSKTPISALLSSIQRGFLFTPSSPLSPPQSYVGRGPGTQDLPIPFPLNMDTNSTDVLPASKKPFMFGVPAADAGRPALGNVENLGIHNT